MLRLALGAILLAACLFATTARMPSVVLAPDDVSRSANTAQAQSCADTNDGGGGWNPLRHAATSTIESAWKWRSLQARFASTTGPGTIVVTGTTARSRPRAPAAPAHLLHTPLLI